jgi:hypothetical protein
MEAVLIVMAGLIFFTFVSCLTHSRPIEMVAPAVPESGGCLGKLIPLFALGITLPFILILASKTIA